MTLPTTSSRSTKYSRTRSRMALEASTETTPISEPSRSSGMVMPSTPRWYWMPSAGSQGRFSSYWAAELKRLAWL